MYILPVEIGSSASSELYKVPFGAAVPVKTIAKVSLERVVSLIPLIDPGTDPAVIGLQITVSSVFTHFGKLARQLFGRKMSIINKFREASLTQRLV